MPLCGSMVFSCVVAVWALWHKQLDGSTEGPHNPSAAEALAVLGQGFLYKAYAGEQPI